MKSHSILVVGSINMDLTIYGIPSIPPMHGELAQCENYAFEPGGKGANQACASKKLGMDVVLVGRIGNDQNGQQILEDLKRNRINIKHIIRDENDQTGLVILFTENNGQNYSYGVLGANMKLSELEVKKAMESQEFDMVLMQLEMPLETAYRTYELAKSKDIPVILDAGPSMRIPLGRFKGIEIITPNEAEAKALTGIAIVDKSSAVSAAKAIYKVVRPKYTIIKMGSEGVIFYDGKVAKHLPAFKVNALDTAAAGDTFNAALCMKLCIGEDIYESINFAQAAAAISVTKKGALNSIPTIEEVNNFLKMELKKSSQGRKY